MKITKEQARELITNAATGEVVACFVKADGKLRNMRILPEVTINEAQHFVKEGEEKKPSKNPHLIHVVDLDLYEDEKTSNERSWRAIDENRLLSVTLKDGTVYEVSDDFIFQKGVQISTDDVYHDLFVGGYISPEEMLVSEEQTKKVNDAIAVVEKFISDAQEDGSLEVI